MSLFLSLIGSVYTFLFVVTSAHTLIGPFILMFRLLDQTLCLDQLYSCTVIMLSSLCTPVRHFVVTSAHTLLGPFILMLRLVDQTLCLDQLYSCKVIMLSSLCTPVRHIVKSCYYNRVIKSKWHKLNGYFSASETRRKL